LTVFDNAKLHLSTIICLTYSNVPQIDLFDRPLSMLLFRSQVILAI